MSQPVFIGGENGAPGGRDTEQVFFGPVDAFDMYRIIPVIGKCLHRIEKDPEHDENGKAQDKTTCSAGQVIKTVEQKDQEELVGLIADEPRRKDQV
jgi:hypothetical protein